MQYNGGVFGAAVNIDTCGALKSPFGNHRQATLCTSIASKQPNWAQVSSQTGRKKRVYNGSKRTRMFQQDEGKAYDGRFFRINN